MKQTWLCKPNFISDEFSNQPSSILCTIRAGAFPVSAISCRLQAHVWMFYSTLNLSSSMPISAGDLNHKFLDNPVCVIYPHLCRWPYSGYRINTPARDRPCGTFAPWGRGYRYLNRPTPTNIRINGNPRRFNLSSPLPLEYDNPELTIKSFQKINYHLRMLSLKFCTIHILYFYA